MRRGKPGQHQSQSGNDRGNENDALPPGAETCSRALRCCCHWLLAERLACITYPEPGEDIVNNYGNSAVKIVARPDIWLPRPLPAINPNRTITKAFRSSVMSGKQSKVCVRQ